MATGKELARLMSCGYWKDLVISKPYFCSAQIFSDEGKPISITKAKESTFCHIRILFKDCSEEVMEILSEFLRHVASTRSEMMHMEVFDTYGFQEIVIS